MKPLIIFLFTATLISCNADTKPERTSKENKPIAGPAAVEDSSRRDTAHRKTADLNITTPDTVPEPDIDRGKYTRITSDSKIKILSSRKGPDKSSGDGEPACDTWKLTNQQILTILRSSKEMDGHEFHYMYSVLPCAYHGEVTINGQLATYRVNGGAYTTLIFKDTAVYLGYERSDFKKYFIEGRAKDSDFRQP
jgi:hypothetical protein